MQGEVSAKIAAVRAAAADLGWTETEIAAIAGKLPTGAQRAEIQALARTRDRLQDAVQDTTRAYHDKVAALAELDRLIAISPPQHSTRGSTKPSRTRRPSTSPSPLPRPRTR